MSVFYQENVYSRLVSFDYFPLYFKFKKQQEKYETFAFPCKLITLNLHLNWFSRQNTA